MSTNRLNPAEVCRILECSIQEVHALVNTKEIRSFPSNNKDKFTLHSGDVNKYRSEKQKYSEKMDTEINRGGMTMRAPPTVEQGDDIYFSFGEVARQLERTPDTVARWIKDRGMITHKINEYSYIDGFELSRLQTINKQEPKGEVNKSQSGKGKDMESYDMDKGLKDFKDDEFMSLEKAAELLGLKKQWCLQPHS